MLLFQGFLFCVEEKQVLYLIEGKKKKSVVGETYHRKSMDLSFITCQ